MGNISALTIDKPMPLWGTLCKMFLDFMDLKKLASFLLAA